MALLQKDEDDEKKPNETSMYELNDSIISNPVIVNIAISEYDDAKLGSLPGCKIDLINIHNLWTNMYALNKLYENEKERVTSDEVWEILVEARTALNFDGTFDALIISYSGHGDRDRILTSEYDGSGKKGEILVSEILSHFAGKEVKKRVLKLPKFVVIDTCRTIQGINETKTSTQIHPLQNFGVICSNVAGYKTFDDKEKGGPLITSFCDIFSKKDVVSNNELSVLVKYITKAVIEKSDGEQCIGFYSLLICNVWFKFGKEFIYKSDLDDNGILYFLATNYGKDKWVNPATNNMVTVASSKWSCGHVNDVVGRTQKQSYSSPIENSWFSITFNNEMKIKPTAYTLANGCSSDIIRNWNIEASDDGENWIALKKHTNDNTLTKLGQSHTWKIDNCSNSYRMFRIYMTGTGASNTWYLGCCGFEIYGTLTR